jgi:hypothetical protein
MKVRIDQMHQKVKNIRRWELDILINKINYIVIQKKLMIGYKNYS